MTTTQESLILLALLCVMLLVCCAFLLLRQSRSSTTPSPIPTSTPPTPSVDPVVTLTTTMMKMMTDQMTESRRMTETLLLGREQPAMGQTSSTYSIETQPEYDPDSTPLSPGIEAILAREVEEDEQLRLMRERAALQEKLRATTLEWQRLTDPSTSEDSLPGPWSGPEERSDIPT